MALSRKVTPMNNPETLPCVECICIPICRHKEYSFLFFDCNLIQTYIPHHGNERRRNQARVEQLEEALKPTIWTYTIEHQYKSAYEMESKLKLILYRDTLSL